uniref:Uncharacterized protein n=1 Tax=Timema poppense TaxID=170557 RepID=A0A7R9CNL7_TIMPO|nr:unnamed protein product [Timema poppensis]
MGDSANSDVGLQRSLKKNSASSNERAEGQDSTSSLVASVESAFPAVLTWPWVLLMTVTMSIMSICGRYELVRFLLDSTGSHHSRPSSSREQLTGATLVVVPSPQPGCPRSIFGRLGIRKPSLLSLTSPQGHGSLPANTTARTFSLDDLLGPPPRTESCFRECSEYSSGVVEVKVLIVGVGMRRNFVTSTD